jgi:hypothetical protein
MQTFELKQIYAGILLFVDMRLATGSQEGWVFGPITQSYPATFGHIKCIKPEWNGTLFTLRKNISERLN